jgi:hypothetical protein
VELVNRTAFCGPALRSPKMVVPDEAVSKRTCPWFPPPKVPDVMNRVADADELMVIAVSSAAAETSDLNFMLDLVGVACAGPDDEAGSHTRQAKNGLVGDTLVVG